MIPRQTPEWLRVLVCGGRDYGNFAEHNLDSDPLYEQKKLEYNEIRAALHTFSTEQSILYNPNDNWLPNDIIIISGGAKGVDSVAIDWAVVNWCQFFEFPADWKKYGKAAGHIRNKQMLDEGKPDVVLAFRGGKGTANMIKQAEERGVPVIRVT